MNGEHRTDHISRVMSNTVCVKLRGVRQSKHVFALHYSAGRKSKSATGDRMTVLVVLWNVSCKKKRYEVLTIRSPAGR